VVAEEEEVEEAEVAEAAEVAEVAAVAAVEEVEGGEEIRYQKAPDLREPAVEPPTAGYSAEQARPSLERSPTSASVRPCRARRAG
jgi:hypothetical protein